MELVSPDRRVLKAFYTQYVAVLLIILTFTVGAFQRTLTPAVDVVEAPVWHPRAVVGSLPITDAFTTEGGVRLGSPQLTAVSEVLKSHDLGVRVTYIAPHIDFDTDSSSIRRAFRRLEAVRSFLIAEGVSARDISLVTRGNIQDADSIRVEFIDLEDPR